MLEQDVMYRLPRKYSAYLLYSHQGHTSVQDMTNISPLVFKLFLNLAFISLQINSCQFK